jgi:hypothetical protein
MKIAGSGFRVFWGYLQFIEALEHRPFFHPVQHMASKKGSVINTHKRYWAADNVFLQSHPDNKKKWPGEKV